ncbi:MAG: pdxA [Chlorobi bacterium]|nr:pdxA [Chlorobiota bacterium]
MVQGSFDDGREGAGRTGGARDGRADSSGAGMPVPPKVIFTIGDINGVGPEVLVKALALPSVHGICRPVIAGNAALLKAYLLALPIADARVSEGALFVDGEVIPIIEIPSDAMLRIGEIDARAGRLAGDAIIHAAEMALGGDADAIVTMPISKRGLNAGGHDFPGHTEMLASIAGGDPLMMLMTRGLRVAIVTIHAPLRDVPDMITWPRIELCARQLVRSLQRDFAVERPAIAVLGLNPHAGETGLIGREEVEIIAPTLQALRAEGMNLEGPLPADGFFARFTPGEYDAVLAMYHDQGLIPLKLFARGAGVNYTAGLPIVRTSPDHGTAFTIAGGGIASERSVVEAVEVAVEVVANRKGA